jgi:hypothetical protein
MGVAAVQFFPCPLRFVILLGYGHGSRDGGVGVLQYRSFPTARLPDRFEETSNAIFPLK